MNPPVMMTSLIRSTIVRNPSGDMVTTSPVRNHPSWNAAAVFVRQTAISREDLRTRPQQLAPLPLGHLAVEVVRVREPNLHVRERHPDRTRPPRAGHRVADDHR